MDYNGIFAETPALRGYAKIEICCETYEMEAGDVVFIPKGMVHFYENIGEEPLKFLCIIPNKEDKITITNEASC
jgi:oxalate decarboxylase/phosphoglucose isomerase-like protein (cupin superfamily)